MYYNINLPLIIAAVVPAVILIRMVYKADKLDKESPRLIGSLVLFGMISTAIAVVLEIAGEFVLNIFLPDEKSVIHGFVLTFVIVGFSEEWAKYLMLKKVTWKNSEFNCMFDGIVYAVTVSLGFALWENIKYVLMYGFSTALVRAVTAVPGHASFGVFMGIFYGMAKKAELNGRMPQARNCKRMCIFVPLVIHGFYDFLAMGYGPSILFYPFVIALFFFAFKAIKNGSKGDAYLINQNVVTPDPIRNYNAPPKNNDYTNYGK